jgi:hypothetical protein
MTPSRPSRLRIASAHVLGRPPKRLDRNAERARLLACIVETICRAPEWAPLDALLLPAGFFRLDAQLGAHDADRRAELLLVSEVGGACLAAATRLGGGTGGLLVVGADTLPYAGFSGDQFMAAWSSAGVVGSARKLFPSHGDTWPKKGLPYLLYDRDADDAARLIRLPSGGQALLCLCYDAFAFSELARGPTGSRAAMRYVGDLHGHRELSAAERTVMLERFDRLVRREAPEAALIAVHGFEQPGGETRWQRHGIASASAGLGGGLAVGAAHYRHWLPDRDVLDHATLASVAVPKAHLREGLYRKARKATASHALVVKIKGEPLLRAVVRLFEH